MKLQVASVDFRTNLVDFRMNSDVERVIVNQCGLSKEMSNILDLHGISTLKDLTEIDETVLNDIEMSFREPSFIHQHDLTSKKQQINFFGTQIPNALTYFSNFKFKSFDRKKLLRLPQLATDELKKIEEFKKLLEENVQKVPSQTAEDCQKQQSSSSTKRKR